MGFTTSTRVRRGIGLCIALASLTFFMVRAQARQRPETRTIEITTKSATSSFWNANFSFDGKGMANQAIYSGDSSMGPFTGEGMSQSAFDGKACVLNGIQGQELSLVGHFASTKYQRTGDLLFERGKPGDLISCLLPDLTFEERGTVDIVGGTGAFSGAHGTEAVLQRGQIKAAGVGVNPDLSPAFAAFGSSQGTFNPTFTVPK